MFAMSPEQMHRQVVRSQDQARHQVALERQAAKAHKADAVQSSGLDTTRPAFATVRRIISSFRPRSVRHAAAH